MKRTFVLGMVILFGVSLITVHGFQGQSGPSAASIARLKIEKVKDNLYVIADNTPLGAGGSGGATAVLVTDTGVIISDVKVPGYGETLLKLIKTVTDKPVTTLINTHHHGDHTGSNEFFGATIDSVVQENAKTNMAKTRAFQGDKAKFLPKRTFKDKLTIGSGRNQVDLYYFGAGHTNGDAFVVFPSARAVLVGDIFAWKALPIIDTGAGGSALEHPKTLAKAVATIKNIDTVIPGHSPIGTWNDLKAYADFILDFVTWNTNEMKAGKTVDQAAAEYKIPAQFVSQGYTIDAGRNICPGPSCVQLKPSIQRVYDELKK
jgi:cyclase